MKEQIELLRESLHKLMEINSCLYSNEVVKLSQELDKLIYAYYSRAVEI
ncbi:aspartyl-phosphate phosphatase Spo0E family protein [Clostridium sp. P21]|uniref:Aspartyl-phosphate phosphatase Spo0E family protein n=2 Tax=Clostridium muellerianum TaxID=2716538 RepID=A0A7Y0EFB3_9CLOT|nr:aspartyl-phosphate phosphatase Spo0E family protein [Clostridium muellerianum]NMM62331.1 aspartyl-phosphate phosphatase Spo0E family protein [Clostridium muellerianum]